MTRNSPAITRHFAWPWHKYDALLTPKSQTLRVYLIAAGLVIGQITCYSLFILKHPKHTAVVSVVLILLYGYLYVLLQEQDFALLFGTLGVVMFATRNVDWNRVSATRNMIDEQPEL